MRFVMVDRILQWHVGIQAIATKNISFSEDFFDDHFPLKPIMPGMLIIEGMAQLAGLLLEESIRQAEGRRVKALLSMVEKTKFRQPSYPGDVLHYKAKILAINDVGGKCEVEARSGGDGREMVVSTALLFSFHRYENDLLEAKQAAIVNLWLRDCSDVLPYLRGVSEAGHG